MFVILVSLRSFDDIAPNGLGALPESLTLGAFRTAWVGGSIGGALRNSVDRHRRAPWSRCCSCPRWPPSRSAATAIPLRRTILLLMLAGNLLPPQILLIPVSKICEALGIYDTLFALVVVQVGFGMGFYTFVLLRLHALLPNEVFEAARIDGAGDLRIYATIVLPLCRPGAGRAGARWPAPGCSTT